MKVALIIACVVFQSAFTNAQQVNNDMPVAFGLGESYDQYTPVIGPAYTVYQLPYGINFYGAAFTGPNVPMGHGLFYTDRTPCGEGNSCQYTQKTQQIIDLDLSQMMISGLTNMNMDSTGYFTPENDNIQDGTYSYFLTRGQIDGNWYLDKWSTGSRTLIASVQLWYVSQLVLDVPRSAAYVLGNNEYGVDIIRKINLNTMTVVPFINSTIWNGYNTTTIKRIALDGDLNQICTAAFPTIGGSARLICIDGLAGTIVGSPTPLYVSLPNEFFFIEIYNGDIYMAYTTPRGNTWDDTVASQPCTLISRPMGGSSQFTTTFDMGEIGGHTFIGSYLYLGSQGGELIKFSVGSSLIMQDRMLLQSHMATPPSCAASAGSGPIISTMGVSPSDPNTMYITGTWWSLIIVVNLNHFSSVVPCVSSSSYPFGDLNGFPIWAIVLICLGGLAVISALIALSVRELRRRRHHHHAYHHLDHTVVQTYH